MAVFVGSGLNDVITPDTVSFFVISSPRGARPSNAADIVEGRNGNDTIDGGGGNDYLDGGANDDDIEGGSGDDYILGGSGSDDLNGGAGDDTVLGNAGDDVIHGDFGTTAFGNDVLRGGDGRDRMYGGGGDDLMYGGRGNDVMRGNDGNDLLDGKSGADDMAGNRGNDRYRVDNAGDEVTEYANQGSDTVISTITSFTLPDHVEALELEGNAIGGIGNGLTNLIVGNARDNLLGGGGGDDSLVGEAGADYLYDTGGGNDTANGGTGDDTLNMGAGNDVLIGGPGGDILGGGADADRFLYNAASDSTAANPDIISDIDVSEDKIDLRQVYSGVLDYLGYVTAATSPLGRGQAHLRRGEDSGLPRDTDRWWFEVNTDTDAALEMRIEVRLWDPPGNADVSDTSVLIAQVFDQVLIL